VNDRIMEDKDSFRAKIRRAKAANAKSKLDENQVEEFKEAFMLFDEDNGGSIDDEEFENLMGMLGYTLSEEEIAQIFNAVDEEGEGEILFDDFLTLMVVLMDSDEEEAQLESAFRILDKKQEGKIPLKQVQKLLKSLGEQLTSKEMKYFSKLVDSDNDGLVSLNDIRHMLATE